MAGDVDKVLNDLIGRVGRVRRWLLALSALKIAALGLAFICLYVGLYAWIDHHVRLGRVGRVSAFVLFAGMIAAGVYTIVRVLRREMTYAHAANYIENRRSFDQQLVAAVEYYEGRADYPYSKALARQLVLQVDREAQGYSFDATVDKWRGYLLSGFILLCLLVVGVFVRQNVLYVSSYLARLLRPFSEVQPMSATAVDSVTGDIVTSPDVPVTLTATVRGRAPDTAALLLTCRDPNDPNARSGAASERIEIIPARDAEGNTTLTATTSFDAMGRFEYRFEAGDACSASHTVSVCERPAVKSMTATITPPAEEGMPPIPPYEQDLEDRTLEVLPGSQVQVRVQATMPLQEATTVAPNGKATTQSLDGADTFGFQVTANASSSIRLSMVSLDGLAGGAPQELRIALKSDESPQFKLLSPEGDYLATDVASIPIVFEVTDDFGLTSARLFCEFPNGESVVLESAAPQGTKQVHLAHTLELEQYDLHVGDSILFYATAADVETGHGQADANGCSEVYFIEIRPYRQYWHPESGGPPSSQPGPIAEDLITILEYTRGILKKTWALARSSEASEQDRSESEALAGDVRYCAERLARIRDDPQAGFSDTDKGVLNAVLDSYGQAEDRLDRGDASAAVPPEQDAYRTLRKFIDELHMKWSPPESGQSVPQQTPERVRLQERPEDRQLEKERIDSQLKEMQQKVDTLTHEQQSLKADLAKAMQRQKQPQSTRQSATRQSPDGGSQAQQGQDQGAKQSAAQGSQAAQKERTQSVGQGDSARSSGASQPGGQSGEGQGGEGSAGASGQAREGQDGSSLQTPRSAAGGRMSRTGAPSTAGGKPGPSSTDADAQLRMLQAKQKALREQVAQLNAELGRLPVSEYSAQGAAQSQAQEHLKQAVEEMKRFEEKIADARYNSPASSESGDMAGAADSAARRLAEAGEALGQTGSPDEQRTAAEKAQDMAEQLARDAQAYDESLSDAEKEQMRARLAAAERMLESMGGPQWTTVSQGGGPSSSLVYTKDGHMTPAETARLLARQFWSVALESRRRESRAIEQEPSDVEFFEAENQFFENAATFRRSRGER